MPFRTAGLLLLALVAPAMAQAGAWPRQKGEGFVAYTVETDAESGDGTSFSTYLEYGLTPGLTIGMDWMQNGSETYKALAFLRWHISNAQDGLKLGYSLGAGTVDGEETIRPGLSVGHGLDFGASTGWINLDTYALFNDAANSPLFEAELTFGWKPDENRKVILQVQAGAPDNGDIYAKFAPSLVFRRGPGRYVSVGAVAGFVEVDDFKLNLGLWQKF